MPIANLKPAMSEMKITRRFRREMQQELQFRDRFKPMPLLILAGLGLVLAEATRAEGQAYWWRVIGFPVVFVGGYFVAQLAAAQLKARGQPFDHTLEMDQDGVQLTDNWHRQSNRYAWSDFERLGINDRHFTIRRRGASRGESYLIDRRKLSPEEERFLGELLVEL